ncbi:hypothetical protein Ptr902_11448 [Pyrenophora tritici-repentis]|nr:hypothetical protein Ptr902_11448 [Pyrenophora tritici-repentis]
MSDAQVFEHFTGSDITDEILAEATLLFNNHYGTWSTHTSNPADRVKLSKQPCLAAARAFGDGCVTAQDLEFMHVNARAVMEASPVAYVREAVLRGKLFDGQDTSGAVSSVDTQFFVDHKEPLGVLAMVKQERDWPLGELLEGFEFLLILKKTFGSQSAS